MDQRHFIIYDLEATCWRSRAPKQVEIIEIGIHSVVVFESHEMSLIPMEDVENVFLTIGKGSTFFVNLDTGLWEDIKTGKLPWEVNQ